MILCFRYDLRLFDDIRWTKKISVFPVGLMGDQGVSSPIVIDKRLEVSIGESFRPLKEHLCRVVGFSDSWLGHRKFPIDMAGFAVNVDYLSSHPNQAMPYKVGYEEDYFLQSLNVSLSDLEPLAECCTKVFVWHTKTISTKEIPRVKYSEPALISNEFYNNTNIISLMKDLEDTGLAKIDPIKGESLTICSDTKVCS